jgi:hypothetical protein
LFINISGEDSMQKEIKWSLDEEKNILEALYEFKAAGDLPEMTINGNSFDNLDSFDDESRFFFIIVTPIRQLEFCVKQITIR